MIIEIKKKKFQLNKSFNISRGRKNYIDTIIVKVKRTVNSVHVGIGECVPYNFYNETIESSKKSILSINGMDFNINNLDKFLVPGSARNAIESALIDLKCKEEENFFWDIFNLNKPKEVNTFETISLDRPDKMALSAFKAKSKKLLKVKLGKSGDDKRIYAIRKARPDATIIVDVNCGWNTTNILENIEAMEKSNVELIEQPLDEKYDSYLSSINTSIPFCADESFKVLTNIKDIKKNYSAINIKLDKCGGLSNAISICKEAKKMNIKIMLGCMVCSSLSIIPAMALTGYAHWIDLDGSLWLKNDTYKAISCYANKINIDYKNNCWGFPEKSK